MNQLTPPLPTDRTDSLQALADQYAQRHRSLENYSLVYFTLFGLLRRLGIDPRTWQGYLLTGLFTTGFLLSLPLVVTAINGQWTGAPIKTWAIVAVALGSTMGIAYPLYLPITADFTSLYRALADESGLRRLIAWERNWYDIRVMTSVGGAFALAVLGLLAAVQRKTSGVAIPVGTIALSAMLLYQVGEFTYAAFLMAIESWTVAGYDYVLYPLSPIDSVAVRRSIRGSNRLGLISTLLVTFIIVCFVILLPAQSKLIGPMALVLLLMAYLGTAFGVLVPRLVMQYIVQTEKEREMAPLQRRLADLTARLRELTDEEYGEMRRLQEVHDTISSSSEDLLPLRAIGQIIGTLLVPTITFVAAVAGETYLSALLERIIP